MAETVSIEARIQAAGPSQGVLSQLWMLPPDPKYGSDWPASGEVGGGAAWRAVKVGCRTAGNAGVLDVGSWDG